MFTAFLFNLLLVKYIGKREKLMEVLFALLLFCKSPWVDKDTGEITSSVVPGHQAKTPLVFLGRGQGTEKLLSLKLCVALSTLLCASGAAYRRHWHKNL